MTFFSEPVIFETKCKSEPIEEITIEQFAPMAQEFAESMGFPRLDLGGYPVEDGVQIRLDGLVVSRSQNLRAIQRYPHSIDRVAIYAQSEGGADLVVYWTNGARCETRFASAEVCRDWCKRSRKIDDSTVVYFPACDLMIGGVQDG